MSKIIGLQVDITWRLRDVKATKTRCLRHLFLSVKFVH
jgi:hypothetical protein